MEIKAKVTKVNTAMPTLKAMASITIDNCFVIKGIKIIEGKNGLFMGMPTYKTAKGDYKDICFTITKEAREKITEAIMKEYNGDKEETQTDIISDDSLPF